MKNTQALPAPTAATSTLPRRLARPTRRVRRARAFASAAAALAAAFALAPAGALSQSPGASLDADARNRIDQVFAEYDRTGGPGCAIGVVQHGELTYARGYGIGQMDHMVPIDERSVFYLASVSKQFTAAAVVIAAHEGHLSLDDDIRAHLPEFPAYEQGTVTVRHLIHHTSGIRDYLTLMTLADTPWQNVLTDAALFDLIMRQKELNFVPGTEHLYSNSGYVLLGEIIKRATGRTLRRYADEKIFRPLGMTRTHFHDVATEAVPGRVFSYHPRSAEPTHIYFSSPTSPADQMREADIVQAADFGPRLPQAAWITDYLINFDKVGDGGLYSSVEDLAQWDAAFRSDVLGVPDFAAQMYERGVLTGGETISYARGLAVGARRGLKRANHAGGLMGFRTMFARYPDQETTVITLCNDGTANSSDLSTAVEDIVLEGEFAEAAAVASMGRRAGPSTAPAARTRRAAESPAGSDAGATGPAPAEILAAVAGAYHSEEIGATWIVEDWQADWQFTDDPDDPGTASLVRRRPGEPGMLFLRRRAAFWNPLDHRGGYTFGQGGIELAFVGVAGEQAPKPGDSVDDDASPTATAFVLTAGRVRNVRFERVR